MPPPAQKRKTAVVDDIDSGKNFKTPRTRRVTSIGTTPTAGHRSTSKYNTLGAQTGYLDNMTIRAEDEALHEELMDMPYRDIPFVSFVKAAFPRVDHLDAKWRERHLKKFNELVDTFLNRLQTKQDKKHNIQSELHQEFGSLLYFAIEKCYGRLRPVVPTGVVKSSRVPHIALVPYIPGSSELSSEIYWHDVQFVVFVAPASYPPVSLEISAPDKARVYDPQRTKKTCADGHTNLLGAREKLAGLALETLSASGLKQHTYGILADNNWLELWYFDRAGAIGSERIDISGKGGRSDLLLALTAIALADKHELGYIAAEGFGVRDANENRAHFPQLGFDEFSLHLSSLTPIWPLEYMPDLELKNITRLGERRGRGLVGRGTVVLSCQAGGIDGCDRVILKYSWQPPPSLRRPEGEFHERVMKKGIRGIPRALGTRDILNLFEGPRGRLHPLLPSLRPVPADDRVLRVIVFEQKEDLKLLEELDFTSNPYEFLHIFKSIVTIHRELFTKAHILHRDINPNNLMYNASKSAGCVDGGWLIDLDFAVQLPAADDNQEIDDSAYGSALDHQDVAHTLALPFRSLDFLPVASNIPPGSPSDRQRYIPEFNRLAALPYFYRHDLESFYWTLWWIVSREAHGKRTTVAPELQRLSDKKPEHSHLRKKDFVETAGTRQIVMDQIKARMSNQQWHIVDNVFTGLNEIFLGGYAARDKGEVKVREYITYENFVQYLTGTKQ